MSPVSNYQTLEINGNQYPVLLSSDRVRGAEEDFVIRALLRLTPDQFTEMQAILTSPAVEVKRIGIDADPIPARFSHKGRWSQHGTGSTTFYKLVTVLLPAHTPAGLEAAFPQRFEQEQAETRINATIVRLEALVTKLANNGTISYEQRDKLLGEEWQGLLAEDRVQRIGWESGQVQDAEKDFLLPPS